jgi:uncharacterized protein (TIGR02453 family)
VIPGLNPHTVGVVLFEGFGTGIVRFYEELAANNTRDWWQANKQRYELEVRAPLEHLLEDLRPEFGEAKVFRPNRDTRFARDKSPYKTNAAAVIGQAHEGVGTYYLSVSAEGIMVGGGAYMPASDQLARLREAIDDDKAGPELEAIVADIRRKDGEIGAHDELKTAPRGYPADHPRIELLRFKGIIGWWDHEPGPWLHSTAARDTVAERWRSLGPLNRWLVTNVGPSELPQRER